MGIQIPKSSSKNTNGTPLRNSTCFVYAPGPLVANALETKCSIRNKPIGMIPVSECRRRRKNECPWPARSGATPFLMSTGDELTVEATDYYILLSNKEMLKRIAYTAAMRWRNLIPRTLMGAVFVASFFLSISMAESPEKTVADLLERTV